MSVPAFSFSDAEVAPGRFTEVVNAGSDLFKTLKAKFGHKAAIFLASHVGFEDDDYNWEGVRPLGQGAFGRVGLWAAKDKEGNDLKASKNDIA